MTATIPPPFATLNSIIPHVITTPDEIKPMTMVRLIAGDMYCIVLKIDDAESALPSVVYQVCHGFPVTDRHSTIVMKRLVEKFIEQKPLALAIAPNTVLCDEARKIVGLPYWVNDITRPDTPEVNDFMSSSNAIGLELRRRMNPPRWAEKWLNDQTVVVGATMLALGFFLAVLLLAR